MCGENCPIDKDLQDFLKTIKPCDGFIHKCSCNSGCVYYTYKIINKDIFTTVKHNFCRGEKMNTYAMKWIARVGCYTYRCNDGNNTK